MNIVVVGAGVIGASISKALAKRGASVTVLDMRGPGRGASWASAGLLAPYTEAQEKTPLLDMGIRSLALFDKFIENTQAASGQSTRIEYARTGTFEVAFTDDDAAHLTSVKSWLDRTGAASEWLEGAAARMFEPSIAPEVRGGLFIPQHGFVGVNSLVTALVNAARFAGATIESPIEAVDVTHNRQGVVVRAGDRRYEADRVVIAAGSWSRRVRVAGLAPIPVRPVRGQMLHLRWTAERKPARPVWGPGCYTVPWSDGTVLVGATVEEVGFDESTTVAGLQSLTAAVSRMLADASTAAVIDARAGLRPATADGLPIIGISQTAPNVMFATGHFRNGILLAPLTASMVETALLDGRMDAMMTVTSPERLVSAGGAG